MTDFRQQADRAADGSKEVAAGVDQVVDQIEVLRTGLDLGGFPRSMKYEAAGPSMAGFNIPAEVLTMPDFRAAAKAFISPDGRSARYLVFTTLDPFSPAAMDQVNAVADTARAAQPNTTLAGATISMGGYPAALAGHPRLLPRRTSGTSSPPPRAGPADADSAAAGGRSAAVPGRLGGGVVLRGAGIGVLVFQYGLGQPLHWTVPPLAFVVLVAVGADYNLLFASRLRDASPPVHPRSE